MLTRLLFTFIFTILYISSYASEPFKKEHHFQIGAGIPFEFNYFDNDISYITVNGIPVDIPDSGQEQRQKTYKSPVLSASYLFIPKKWIAVGASFVWYKKHGDRNYILFPSSNHKYSQQNLGLRADIKLYWLNRKYFDIYSSFAVGVLYKKEERKYKSVEYKDKELMASIDYSLIGMTFGNRVYGILELESLNRVKAGMGYKF